MPYADKQFQKVADRVRLRAWRRNNPEKKRSQAKRSYARRKASGRARADKLHKKYGITVAQRDQLFAAQGSKCAICHTMRPGRYWHTDHDHGTNIVRGILCESCNLGLGQFRDNPELLRSAAQYVEWHKAKVLVGLQVVSTPQAPFDGKNGEIIAPEPDGRAMYVAA